MAAHSPQQQIPLISVIVPVFNEEGNVSRTVSELRRVASELRDYQFEFIFTDNCSSDRTFELLSELAQQYPEIRVARFARNFGFQSSVLAGYRLAGGEAVIQIDADLEDPPDMFGAFLEKWREGYDMVVGVRQSRIEGRLVQFGRRVFYRSLRHLAGTHVPVDAGDFRLIDRSIVDKLRNINEPHLYLRGLVSSLARRQVGIPFERSDQRQFGVSKFGPWNLALLAADGIVSHSSFPLLVSFYVGIGTAFGSFLLGVFYILLRYFSTDGVPPGFTTTQILILFGIGLNSIFMGIMGIYVGRIYDQVRSRPIVIISDLVNFDSSVDQVERELMR